MLEGVRHVRRQRVRSSREEFREKLETFAVECPPKTETPVIQLISSILGQTAPAELSSKPVHEKVKLAHHPPISAISPAVTNSLLTGSGSYDHAGEVTAVDVRLLTLPMREALAADHGTTSTRSLTVIGLKIMSQTNGSTWAWGESAALATTGYSAESAEQSFAALSAMASRLIGRRPVDIISVPGSHAGQDGPKATDAELDPPLGSLSSAAVEMAALDAVGTLNGRSLAEMLGSANSRIPAGAAVGLGSPDGVAAACDRLIASGYRRLKLKIQPGHDVELVGEVIASQESDVDWHVDANGSYNDEAVGTSDAVGVMVKLAELGVTAIEQPFAPQDLSAGSQLVSSLAERQLNCQVVADEGAATAEAIIRLSEQEAATAVTVKPSRYGGLAAALSMVELCRRLGLAVSAGGMIESALGRRSLAALAGHPAFSLTGDLSPSSRWMAMDPWPDLATHQAGSGGTLMVEIPSEPGVAPPPDVDVLDQLTANRFFSD